MACALIYLMYSRLGILLLILYLSDKSIHSHKYTQMSINKSSIYYDIYLAFNGGNALFQDVL